MLDRLGPMGIVGLLVIVGGLAVIGWQNPIIAAGIGMVVAGIGLVAAGMVKSMLGMFGMA